MRIPRFFFRNQLDNDGRLSIVKRNYVLNRTLIFLVIFSAIAESTPVGRRWGVGTTLYGDRETDIIKGISKYWALVSACNVNLDFDSKGLSLIRTYGKVGVCFYSRSDLPLAPNITGTTGINFIHTRDTLPLMNSKYYFYLFPEITAGVDYFFLKHFSIGIRMIPIQVAITWTETLHRTVVHFSSNYSPKVTGMIYF